MRKNYTDVVETMASMSADGHDVDRLILTNESMETFLTDGDFTEETEELHDDLGGFELTVERGDGNYIISEEGEEFDL